MITVKIYDEELQAFPAFGIKASRNGGVQTPVKRTDAHDESLFTCSLTILTDGSNFPDNKPYLEEWTKVRVNFDGDTLDYFVTQCDSSVVARKRPDNNVKKTVYKVDLQLIELLFVTQYISMDNLIFSHDISSSGKVTAKTIAEVLQRVNNQIYTMPEADKNDPVYGVPFKLLTSYSSMFWWGDMPAPEFFFNGKTLFQILVEIGDYVGGFPYLKFSKHGEYELFYRQWNDNNVPRHTLSDDEIYDVEYHTTTDGSATIVDSTVENMLNSSANGENTAVYPLPGNEDVSVPVNGTTVKMARNNNFVPPRTESYEYEITDANCFVEVPHAIERVLKLETYSSKDNVPPERGYQNITNQLLEYSDWVVLKETTNDVNSRNYYLYYTIGGRRIENIRKDTLENIVIGTDHGSGGFTNPRQLFLRITYIPRLNGRIKKQRGTGEKPISYIVNQQTNVVNSSAYGKYLQGLVDRMTGNYTIYTVISKRNTELFKTGEFLNGERIYRAEHTYSPKVVVTRYFTSPNWNRRANFVAIPHNQRTWRIPAADEVTQRNIHYAENVFYSINEPITGHAFNGGITADYYGKKALVDFTNKTSKGYVASVAGQDINYARPSLAYIAFKTDSAVNADADDQSIGYAMASCDPVPVDRSIIMTWTAEDNASMGSRSYGKGLKNYTAERQAFCAYPEKAEYVQFKLSSEAPDEYNYVQGNTGINATESGTNETFCLGYPFLTKKQFSKVETEENFNFEQYGFKNFGTSENPDYKWDEGSFLYTHLGTEFAKIPAIKIEKDLREKISFSYQLDFLGYSDTIVYENACVWSALCNRNATTLRVYINSSTPYSEYDVKGRGTLLNTAIADISSYELTISVTGSDGVEYSNIAICDGNDNLMFATNKAGVINSDVGITLYACNEKKKWKKI